MTKFSAFSLPQQEKEQRLLASLKSLCIFHRDNCIEYSNILDAMNVDVQKITSCEQIPFFPVSLFKRLDLCSIPNNMVFKVLTSSGTTGQSLSKMYLDRGTASAQQKTLVHIVSEFMGTSRLPMLIIDCPSVIKDRIMFSARGAGILGFSIFGTDRTYALNDDMSLNVERIRNFLDRHQGKRIMLFGFTFVVWKYFFCSLLENHYKINLENAVLFHGGGWKKIIDEAVTPASFRQKFKELCGMTAIHSYYGMVEQTGSIYMECEYGNLHSSLYSDVIVRRAKDLSPCALQERGIIQVLSELPHSYPGHSLLTEDEGVILGVDSCPCGRKGRYFHVYGRLKNAELRGCSDTYEYPA